MASRDAFASYEEGQQAFSDYLDIFDQYVLANQIPDDRSKAVFLSSIGSNTYALLRSLVAPAKPADKTLEELKKTLSDHFTPEPLEIAETFKFHTRQQQPGETARDFLAALRLLARNCGFDQFLPKALRNQLVCGLRCNATRQKLLTVRNLTLEIALDVATAAEQSLKEVEEMNKDSLPAAASALPVDRVSGSRSKPAIRVCASCGSGQHERRQCPHYNAICRGCGIRGHLQRVCRSTSRRVPQKAEEATTSAARATHSLSGSEYDQQPSDEVVFLHSTRTSLHKPCMVNIRIEGKPIDMEFDTGSSISTLSMRDYQRICPHLDLESTSIRLRPYGATSEIHPLGVIYPRAEYRGQKVQARLFVLAETDVPLFGREWMTAFNLDICQLMSTHSLTDQRDVDALLAKHADLFDPALGKFAGAKAKLHVKENAVPVHAKHRTVPFAIREKVEAELNKLLSEGVISPVEQSEWATPVVPVIKPDGSIRLCGDFKTTLNAQLIVDTYPMPSIDDLQEKLNGGTLFSKLDLSRAFTQIELEETSKNFVTITTHKGLFKYNRLPFGVASAPAIHQRAMDHLLSGLSGVLCYQDDLFVTGKDRTSHIHNLAAVLAKLQGAGLRLSKEKCAFLRPSIVYLGHMIDGRGIHPTEDKVKAIKNAPPPTDVSTLRSFIGMVQYYHKFLPNLAHTLHPLYELLQKQTKWQWTAACEHAFKTVKDMISSESVLAAYNPSETLVLACDASSYGLGAVLSHRSTTGHERPIAFASRTLSVSERNYSQIEKEALSLIFGVMRFHLYLYGRQFLLQTDHRPLVTILGPKTGIPPIAAMRMQRWAAVLSAYTYTIEYRRSEDHANADAMSRLPLPEVEVPCPETTLFHVDHFSVLPVTTQTVREAIRSDSTLSTVFDITMKGWPNKNSSSIIRPYYNCRHELAVHDGCLLRGTRLVIPTSLRGQLLRELHDGHLGMNKMKATARNYFWWPGLDNDIESTCRGCPQCNQVRHAPPATSHKWTDPSGPWHRIHIDFAGPLDGHYFLVVVDAFSKWPEVFRMREATSATTVSTLRTLFARLGLPRVIVSDNGRQFTSREFGDFLKANGIRHFFSAPYHPQSNGLAERFVQTFKCAYAAGSGDPQRRIDQFLIKYRSSENATTGSTPAQLLLGRNLRTCLDLLRPNMESQSVPPPARPLKYTKGDLVWFMDYRATSARWSPGTIVSAKGSVMFWVKPEHELASVIRHQNQLKRRDAVPYSNQRTQPQSQQPASERGLSASSSACSRDATTAEVVLGTAADSEMGKPTLTTLAEGQQSGDAADPVADPPRLVDQGSLDAADHHAANNGSAVNTDRPARRTSERSNHGQPPGYLQNYVT